MPSTLFFKAFSSKRFRRAVSVNFESDVIVGDASRSHLDGHLCKRQSGRIFPVAFFMLALTYFSDPTCAEVLKPTTSPSADVELLLRDDAAYVRGQLPNGMSYTVRQHAVPPGRVAMYLHVKSGALNETAKQNGLAHFVEHMAFNGTKNYPPGTLLPKLSSLGMQFGVHNNAHTANRETVYKLYMPDTKPETIDLALTIFSDFADGLDFDPEQIESERGVVLEELRSRDGVGRRMRTAMMLALYPGSQLTNHDIIGNADVIRSATREEFLDYWNTWYRPDLMTLIVVGDVDAKAIIQSASASRLGTFKPRANSREETTAGIAKFADSPSAAVVLTDKEMVTAQISLNALSKARPAIRDLETYRANELEDLGTWMVNRRLDARVRSGRASFQGASLSIGDIEGDATITGAAAVGKPADWRVMLDELIGEIRIASASGFSKDELDRAKSEWLNTARTAADGMPTVDASAIIGTVSSSMTKDELLISAGQRVGILEKLLLEIDPEQVRAAFANAYGDVTWRYVLAMPAAREGDKGNTAENVAVPSEREVLEAASAFWSRDVITTGPTTMPNVESLLPTIPQAGEIAEQSIDTDLKITTIKFTNGVVMHHKYSDYKRHDVLVKLTFPGGRIQETAENKGVSSAASTLFARPSSSRMDSTQIRDLLTGKSVGLGGSIGVDTLTMNVAGRTDDLELGMRLAHTLITEGRVEPQAVIDWKKSALQAIEAERTDGGAALRRGIENTVYANDIRFTRLTKEDIDRQSADAATAWFHNIVDNAAIEVAIVGDISLEKTTELMSRYVGSLPKRKGEFSAIDPLRKLDRPAGPYVANVTFPSETPKAFAVAGFIGCEVRDTADRRALALAARVMTERMTERLRETERLVYSIQCSSNSAVVIPGTGMVSAGAATDPANASRLVKGIQEIMKEMAQTGPSEGELKSAKQQERNEREVSMREPGYWLNVLADQQYRKRPLAEIKTVVEDFDKVTADQIRDTMNRYLTDSRTVSLTAVPESPVNNPKN